MSIQERICAKMKRARNASGRTQNQVAEKLFITPRHYGRIERGQVNISLDLLSAFAEIHGIEPSHFFEKPCNDNKREIIAEIKTRLSRYGIDKAQKVLEIMKIMEG